MFFNESASDLPSLFEPVEGAGIGAFSQSYGKLSS